MEFEIKAIYIIIFFSIIFLIIGIAGGKYWFTAENQEESVTSTEEEPEETVPVHLGEITRDSIKEFSNYNAALEPESTHYVFPQVSGEVEEIAVDEGDIVEKDDILFTLEGEEIVKQREEAEAALEQAQSQLDELKRGAREEEVRQSEAMVEEAERSLEGARKTRDIIKSESEDLISYREQLINAENQVDNAESQLEMSEDELEQAEISLEEVEDNFERLEYLYEQGAVEEQRFEEINYQKERAEKQVAMAETQYEQAQKNLKNAEKGHQLAEESLEKPREVEQQLANAENQIEIAKTTLKQAQAQHELLVEGPSEEKLKGGEAQVKQAEAALEIAQNQESKLEVTSPASGQINTVEIEEGSLVDPQTSTPPLTVVSSGMLVKLTVNEDIIVNLEEEMEVDLKIPVINEEFTGEVTEISVTRNQDEGGFPVEIEINDLPGNLKAGMYVAVELPQEQAEDALLVPREAVIREGTNYFVFTVDENQERVKKTQIELGISNEDYYEITSGISKEKQVIIQGQNMLEDGDYIEVVAREDI